MTLSRNRLYLIVGIACLAGYVWLYYNHSTYAAQGGANVGVCLIKYATNIPCPSCGSTRALLSLMDGDIGTSLYLNPIGLILGLLMAIIPIWVLYDYVRAKDTLLLFYRKAETFIRRKEIAAILITLVSANWIWNIFKGL